MRSGSNRRIAITSICKILGDTKVNFENRGTNDTVSRESRLRALNLLYGKTHHYTVRI